MTQSIRLGILTCIALINLGEAATAQLNVVNAGIGTASTPADAEVRLVLKERFQHYNDTASSPHDHYDAAINSPKSARFHLAGQRQKLYINSLEGCQTVVYDAATMTRLKVIAHHFTEKDSSLFRGMATVFGYPFKQKLKNYNVFDGKPVESCLSHNGKYLWVPYYRRDYDANAVSPSAVAVIDTEQDSIVRVMPTGALPKMVAASPDNKYLAVTHWGDNTIGLMNIESDSVGGFWYDTLFVVDKRLPLEFGKKKVNRDAECGFCLRGTVFTPDSKYLLVGRMGGGGIAVFDVAKKKYLGTAFGTLNNVRHLVIKNGDLFISTNSSGRVQKIALQTLLDKKLAADTAGITLTEWKNVTVGTGARTIETTSDGAYIIAAINNESKLVVVRSSDLKVVAAIAADSFPVGLSISSDDRYIAVTAQGRHQGGDDDGGNSVMIFEATYPLRTAVAPAAQTSTDSTRTATPAPR